MKSNPIRMNNRDEGFWIDPKGKVSEIDEHLQELYPRARGLRISQE